MQNGTSGSRGEISEETKTKPKTKSKKKARELPFFDVFVKLKV